MNIEKISSSIGAFSHIIHILRVVIITTIFGALAIIATPQSRDLIRSLSDKYILCLFLVFTFMWSILSWHTSRYLLDISVEISLIKKKSSLYNWIPRIIGLLPFIFFFVSFFLMETYTPPFSMVIILAILYLVFVINRKKYIKDKNEPEFIDKIKNIFIILNLIVLIIFIGLSFINPLIFQKIGSLPILLIFLSSLLSINYIPFSIIKALKYSNKLKDNNYSLWVKAILNLPILSIVFILMVLVFSNNHIVRKIETDKDFKTKSLGDDFKEWIRVRKDSSYNSYPVILIAAEGGGIRSAYWTTSILSKIQDEFKLEKDENDSFYKHIYAISSVSGGTLGSSVFSALIKDNENNIFEKGSKFFRFPYLSISTSLQSPRVNLYNNSSGYLKLESNLK